MIYLNILIMYKIYNRTERKVRTNWMGDTPNSQRLVKRRPPWYLKGYIDVGLKNLQQQKKKLKKRKK